MHTLSRIRRSLALATIFALTAAAAGCGDSPTRPADHEDADAVRLTVGTQSVTVDDVGAVTGGPLQLTLGTHTITAQFLDHDGDVINATLPANEYTLGITVAADGRLAFNRTTQFGGTITANTVGTTTVQVSLMHGSHPDFGPVTLPVTVVAAQ